MVRLLVKACIQLFLVCSTRLLGISIFGTILFLILVLFCVARFLMETCLWMKFFVSEVLLWLLVVAFAKIIWSLLGICF